MSNSFRKHATQHPASLGPGGGSTSRHIVKPGQSSWNHSNNELFLEKPITSSSHPSILQAGHRRKLSQPSFKASNDELFFGEPNTASNPRSSFSDELFLHKPTSDPSPASSTQIKHGTLPLRTAAPSKQSNQLSHRPELGPSPQSSLHPSTRPPPSIKRSRPQPQLRLQTSPNPPADTTCSIKRSRPRPQLRLLTSFPPPAQTAGSVQRSERTQDSLARSKHTRVSATDEPRPRRQASKQFTQPSSPRKSRLERPGPLMFSKTPKTHKMSPHELWKYSQATGHEVSPMTSPISPTELFKVSPQAPEEPKLPSSSQARQSKQPPLHSNQPYHPEPRAGSMLSDESRWVNTHSKPALLQPESWTQHGGAKKGGFRKWFGGRGNKL